MFIVVGRAGDLSGRVVRLGVPVDPHSSQVRTGGQGGHTVGLQGATGHLALAPVGEAG